jgi:O-antigen/teichoic acid export membrane protein
MVVALVSLPLVLHGLGPAAFGTWVLVQTFSAITGWFSLADIGIGTATTKAIAERSSLGDDNAAASVVSSAMTTFIALGLVCAAGLALIGPPLLPGLFRTPPALRHGLRIAVVMFSGQVFLDLITEGTEACLEGLQRVDLSRGIDGVRRTVVAVATVAAAQVNGHLATVAVASLIASAVGTVLGAGVLARHLPARLARPSVSEVRGLFAYGWVVAILRPLGVIQRTMDRLIVGAVLGPAAVSLVEIATQVMNGADAVLSASSYAVIPSAAWLSAREDRHTLRELLLRGTKYSLLVTVPVGALAAVMAGPLVRVWLGRQYGPAAGLAAVAVLYTILTAPIQVGSNLLLGTGRAMDILRAAGAAVVVNLTASLVLVHVTGIVGAFQATLLSALVIIPVLARSMLRSVDSSTTDFIREAVLPILGPTTALVAIAGPIVLLPLSDVAKLAFGTVAGLTAFFLIAWKWSVQTDELHELRTLIGRQQPNV